MALNVIKNKTVYQNLNNMMNLDGNLSLNQTPKKCKHENLEFVQKNTTVISDVHKPIVGSRVIDLNNMDWSFILSFVCLYD